MFVQSTAFVTVTQQLYVELKDVVGGSLHKPVDSIDPTHHADLALNRPRLTLVRYYVHYTAELYINGKTVPTTYSDYLDVDYQHSPINLTPSEDGTITYDPQMLQAQASAAGFDSFDVTPKGKVLYYNSKKASDASAQLLQGAMMATAS